jgi:hypothetical protein
MVSGDGVHQRLLILDDESILSLKPDATLLLDCPAPILGSAAALTPPAMPSA